MKLLKWISLLPMLILLLPLHLMAGGLLVPWSAQSAALGNSTLLCHSVSAFNVNPAISECGLEFTVNRLYDLPELPRYLMAAGSKWQKFHFGMGLSDLDHSHYNELTAILNSSYHFQALVAGVNFRYHRIEISGKGKRDALSGDLGLAWQFDNFKTACSWLNCTEAKFANDVLPVYLIWESFLTIEKNLEFGIRLEKESGFEFQPGLASSFAVYPRFKILASYASNPQNIGCGFALDIKSICVSYAAVYHPELDFTHYITVSYGKLANSAITP